MPTVAVCVKWVDLHPTVDQLTGDVSVDDRRRGFSASDGAALEVALQLAERGGDEVAVVSVAPAAAASALDELAASGAHRVVHVVAADDQPSGAVGAALASALRAELADLRLVITGDYSGDRGSGSVPSFVAHHLGWAQACGLIGVAADGRSGVRRLDGGRREHIQWGSPAVISVEGSVARLRRAPLRAVMAARHLPHSTPPFDAGRAAIAPEVGPTQPLRPRARAFPSPHGDSALSRIVELTGALVERTPPRRVDAAPADAAAEILSQLRAWGYLD